MSPSSTTFPSGFFIAARFPAGAAPLARPGPLRPAGPRKRRDEGREPPPPPAQTSGAPLEPPRSGPGSGCSSSPARPRSRPARGRGRGRGSGRSCAGPPPLPSARGGVPAPGSGRPRAGSRVGSREPELSLGGMQLRPGMLGPSSWDGTACPWHSLHPHSPLEPKGKPAHPAPLLGRTWRGRKLLRN